MLGVTTMRPRAILLVVMLAVGLARPALAQLVPTGPEFRVNGTTAGGQEDPGIGMAADGRFVVAWASSGQDGGGYGIYAQRYAADGAPLGTEFRVNTHTLDDQMAPSVAMAADGRFIVAWESYGQDGSGYGIYAQRYAADGMPVGTEFRANATLTNDQAAPSVAMADDGRFVVAWNSFLQDGGDTGVYAQRYTTDGYAQGAEFRVNTSTANSQDNPSVAMAADGRFVVAWHSDLQDGDGYGVYAQRYAADGTPLGPEFRVNATTASNQTGPSAAIAAAGRFVVAWSPRRCCCPRER
jgi:hypothetical protein